MTGMAMPQMLAIASGAFEIIAGLMIALNFGARFFAILLIIFVALRRHSISTISGIRRRPTTARRWWMR